MDRRIIRILMQPDELFTNINLLIYTIDHDNITSSISDVAGCLEGSSEGVETAEDVASVDDEQDVDIFQILFILFIYFIEMFDKTPLEFITK